MHLTTSIRTLPSGFKILYKGIPKKNITKTGQNKIL